jgi:hypothetical protein
VLVLQEEDAMTKKKTYKIVRFVFGRESRTVKRGLTLEEAQAHCKNPETSSSTCTNKKNKPKGPWFDGYAEEK